MQNPLWVGIYVVIAIIVKALFQEEFDDGTEYVLAIGWPVLFFFIGLLIAMGGHGSILPGNEID